MKSLNSLECHYCHIAVDKGCVSSVWEGNLHYVEFTCSCGKKNHLKVDLLGGFDPTLFFQKKIEVTSSRSVVRGKEMT